ncbi:MAG: SDR family oxidoreductase [Spirochaetales bacterium]|nr:SDR family oxidoreductase [Spirochaetales bacterium]
MEEKYPLAGRTALITGAAKRIGRACALALAEAGADIIIHFNHSREEAVQLADEIIGSGRKALSVQADLRDEAQTVCMFEQARTQAGKIDILINSASLYSDDTLADMKLKSLEDSMRLHAFAPLILARLLSAQRIPGDIINILDSRVNDYDSRHLSYHLGKRNLFTLTRAMSIEYAPLVKVNAIAPGPILPPAGKDEAYLEKLKESNLLKRTGTVADVCDVMLLLIKNTFITGQVIFTDGGRHIKGQTYGI